MNGGIIQLCSLTKSLWWSDLCLYSCVGVSLQFDNLYIDMNGIIHPCSHPEDKPPPESEEEMYKNIMDYVDRYAFVYVGTYSSSADNVLRRG